MSETINFAIDLGTTNSLIAKMNNGSVEVFKNPTGHKETLPSVVAFRNERIIIGDKAKEFIEKDPNNVFSAFKRKMGTSENFFVSSLGNFKSPVELSTLVLKELKNFVYTGEQIESVVITIPASFDTIQSNATKKAGYEAGFKEVTLLQEPIAASLAFANKNNENSSLQGQWLVYDLGGGTFDVALVKIIEGEMRVVDHEGDNYLGGVDFDNLLIQQCILPYIYSQGTFNGDLHKELRSAKGKYNSLYYLLLKKAEEVKIELTNKDTAEIEFEITDDNDKLHELYFSISKNEFENCIREKIEYSIQLIQSILERNNLSSLDLQEVIMIGGSTYIPLVKRLITEKLGIAVNTSVDPTTAVAIGAAYFAGSKTKSFAILDEQDKPFNSSNINIRTAYAKATNDKEEYFTAAITGEIENLLYRIIRNDGGYDSGLKKLAERISEMLPVVENTNNSFTFSVYDSSNNLVDIPYTPIEIVHGKYTVYGQPLPNDICIEIDDREENTTKLELIFEKNAILPLRKTILKEITKTIKRDQADSLIINVLEGNRYAVPSSCIPLGVIEINGKGLENDLVKGSDIEITLEISESRDLKIIALMLINDQEYSDVFNPSVRKVSLTKLKDEISTLLKQARKELNQFEKTEQFERAIAIQNILSDLEEAYSGVNELGEDDVTDEKYFWEERKRKLAQQLDITGKEQKLPALKEKYFSEKNFCERELKEENDTARLNRFETIIAHEKEYLGSNSIYSIQAKIKELEDLVWEVRRNKPYVIAHNYHYYASQPIENFKDQKKAQQFIQIGDKALERQNYEEVWVAISGLYHLLPDKIKDDDRIKGTGIG